MPLVCLFGAALWNSCTLLEIYGHSVPMYIDPFEFSRPSSVGCCAVFICCLIKTPMFGEKNIHYFCIMFPRYDDHLQHTFQYVSLYIIIAYLIAYHISNWLHASMPDFFVHVTMWITQNYDVTPNLNIAISIDISLSSFDYLLAGRIRVTLEWMCTIHKIWKMMYVSSLLDYSCLYLLLFMVLWHVER